MHLRKRKQLCVNVWFDRVTNGKCFYFKGITREDCHIKADQPRRVDSGQILDFFSTQGQFDVVFFERNLAICLLPFSPCKYGDRFAISVKKLTTVAPVCLMAMAKHHIQHLPRCTRIQWVHASVCSGLHCNHPTQIKSPLCSGAKQPGNKQ